MQLLVGPPASGKTAYLLERTREVLGRKGRVLWICLPSQRAYVYRRATAAGALLGLEVMTSQGLYYRLLAAALRLKPLVVGTARVALVGEALKGLDERLPTPGEASLFARAIAEAKRFNLKPQDLPALDREGERFKAVYQRYERLKGERWDYDDFRSEALALAREGGTLDFGADLLVVDGYRELSPLELRLFEAVGARHQVWLSLPEAPPGHEATHQLAAASSVQTHCFRAPNPVAEARWVLRSLKRDLAEGMCPLNVAVVLPEGKLRAFAALADEYGVPLMDETPRHLSDTPGGKLLLDLIALPDQPTASRLLALPELAPLARAALSKGVSGREALAKLALELGLEASWKSWLARLEAPEDELAWAKELVSALPATSESPYRASFLERAKEARSLARGEDFRRWWAALLERTQVYARPNGGVALLTAKLASGRRWRRLYLMHAVAGAYKAGEDEDYFTPEEARLGLEAAYTLPKGLPKRYAGRDSLFFGELKSRAGEVVISYPEADQGGPLVPERELIGETTCLPRVPPGSRLELQSDRVYQAAMGAVSLGSAHVEGLRAYSECAFRYWARRRVRADEEAPWWRALVAELRALERLSEARLEALGARYPQAESWLLEHQDKLMALHFGLRLPRSGAPQARIDAAARERGQVALYLFAEPKSVRDGGEAKRLLENRWAEWWAAGYLLRNWPQRVGSVRLSVWPLLGAPVAADGEIVHLSARLTACEHKVSEAHARFIQGDVSPSPGFICRDCEVRDICRVARS